MAAQYGILLDVDGVIADSEAVNVRATRKAFEELLGITGAATKDFEAGIGRGAAEYVRAGARAHGRELSDEQVAAAVQARQDNFLAILEGEPLPAFPGVLALIQAALASGDFAVAIATSSTRQKSESVLRSAGVPFERMAYVSGDQVTRKKPDPEVFLLACERLGLPPAKCVVIEDAPNGVAAAHAAGCACIAVTNTAAPAELADADLVVDSLADLNLDTLRGLATTESR
jgi:HAD superfamily hydrolase (TIGR01509 family)